MSEAELTTEEIRAVLMPIGEAQVLLPNATLAEVISYRDPRPLEQSPEWMIGQIEWRQVSVPVVSLAAALGLRTESLGHRSRIAVCNTLGTDSQLPFIGIAVDSIPRLTRVNGGNVEGREVADESTLVLKRVKVAGEDALIPDLDELERMVRGALSTATLAGTGE